MLPKVIMLPVLLLAVSGCTSSVERVNFSKLQLPDSPNWYLLCPEAVCSAPQAIEPPIFPINVKQLHKHWQQLIARWPRVTLLHEDPESLEYTYVMRTAVLRFPDTVGVKLLDLPDGRSSLAIFSRSQYGYYDFGANKTRVQRLVTALSQMQGAALT